MMRPHELAASPVDLESLAAFAADTLSIDPAAVLSVVQDASSMPEIDFAQTAARFASVQPDGPMTNLVKNTGAGGESPLPLDMPVGMFDPGAGRSRLLIALRQSTDEQLDAARGQIQRLRTERLERELEQSPLCYPDAGREELELVTEWAAMQRVIHRSNPAIAGQLVATYILAEADPSRCPIGRPRTSAIY